MAFKSDTERHAARIDRFWEKVNKSGNCWEWTASCWPSGYGAFGC